MLLKGENSIRGFNRHPENPAIPVVSSLSPGPRGAVVYFSGL